MEYIHNRYNALVKVGQDGKKKIYKYGLMFRSFNELLEFERRPTQREKVRKLPYVGGYQDQDKVANEREVWLKAKGEY